MHDKIMSFCLLDQSARTTQVHMSFILKLLLLMSFILESVRVASPPWQCLVPSAADGRELVHL